MVGATCVPTAQEGVLLKPLAEKDSLALHVAERAKSDSDGFGPFAGSGLISFLTERALRETLLKPCPVNEEMGIWNRDVLVGKTTLVTMPGEESKVELGYSVLGQHRRNGYATAAAIALVEHGKERWGLDAIYARIKPDNIPSRKTAAKAGFTLLDHDYAGMLLFVNRS